METNLPTNGDNSLTDPNILFVNFIGAVVFSILGYFSLTRRSKRTAFIERFIPTVTAKEE